MRTPTVVPVRQPSVLPDLAPRPRTVIGVRARGTAGGWCCWSLSSFPAYPPACGRHVRVVLEHPLQPGCVERDGAAGGNVGKGWHRVLCPEPSRAPGLTSQAPCSPGLGAVPVGNGGITHRLCGGGRSHAAFAAAWVGAGADAQSACVFFGCSIPFHLLRDALFPTQAWPTRMPDVYSWVLTMCVGLGRASIAGGQHREVPAGDRGWSGAWELLFCAAFDVGWGCWLLWG